MRRAYLYTLLTFILPLVCKCQGQNFQQLFEEVLDGKVFVYAKPLRKLDFDDPKFKSLFTDYIDSIRYQQLITNIKVYDSSEWTNQELTKQIIIGEDEPILDWNKIRPKLNIDKKDEEWFKSKVEYY